ncbi:MAG TPA: hypothetical protein VFL04_04705, partial [Rectinemataceae bacterium]|nr:hypothetical protein [Rectinemataceae bacterium]
MTRTLAPRRLAFGAFQCAMGLLLLVFTMAPFAWLLISSVSQRRDLITLPYRFEPAHATLERFTAMFSSGGSDIAQAFTYALLNSLIVAGLVTIVGLATGTLASYSFA